MMQKMNAFVGKLKWRNLLIVLPLIWILRVVVNNYLDELYAKSLFPVPFFEGQTTFNAGELTGYYLYMIKQGTLDIYLQTQLFDFVFIVATLVFHGVAGLVVWKLHLNHHVNRNIAIWVWIVGIAAPLMDALENLVSFSFIADTANITSFLTILYSAFAVTKFVLFGITYLGIMFLIISRLVISSIKKMKRQTV